MTVKGNISKAIVERIESRDFATMPKNGDITIQVVKDLFVSIAKATDVLGVSTTQYTRRLLKQGTLGGIKIHVRGNRTRWFLLTEVLNQYRAYQDEKRRLTRYVVKMPMGLLTELREWLKGKEPLCTAYPQSLEKRKRSVTPRTFFDSLDIDELA